MLHAERLLRIVCGHPAVSSSDIGGLTHETWDAWLDVARRHRLGPLLRWRLDALGAAGSLPSAVADELKQLDHFWTMRSLATQAQVVRASRLLSDHGIQHAFLKGSFLAYQAYPHPRLRPTRDLDVLVRPADAVRAFSVLLGGGFTRFEEYQGNIDAASEVGHHLPPLRSAQGKVTLEVHARLYPPYLGLPDPSVESGFWDRVVERPLNGTDVPYESPTDLLLHLVLHGAVSHTLDNGPLLLMDIVWLTEREVIDWSAVWARARDAGHDRTVALVLALLGRMSGRHVSDMPEVLHAVRAVPVALLDNACVLMLQGGRNRDFEHVGAVPAGPARIWYLTKLGLKRIFRSRVELAAIYPVSADSWRIYPYYLMNVWRLLTDRLPTFTSWLGRARSAPSVEARVALMQWISGSRRDEDARDGVVVKA